MTYPYATQQAGWSDFADELDALALGINPGTLLAGQFGGKISEHIDELTVIVGGVEGLSDSAAELATVCGVQDGFDRELVACPATKERVEEAEAAAKKAQVLLRAGQCEPEVAALVIARADELAQQRREAVEHHAEQTSGTHFDEPESVGLPDAHYPGGTEGEPGNEPGKKGGDDEFGDWGTPGETKPSETPAPSDGVNPLPEVVSPEPSGPSQTPAPRIYSPDGSVELRPERVQPETTLSRGDAALVSPSSSMLGQTPQAAPVQQAWPQPPQYTGISQPGRMLGNVNPQNSPQRSRDRQEPEGTRPVPAETLAAIPVSHAVASTIPSAPSPNVGTPGTPGTHTSAATTPAAAPSAPGGHTPTGVGPTPMTTVGPGAKSAVTGGGMREKPVVPDALKAVLDEQTVRDLERSLSEVFPEPDKPNADPIPTGAIR